MSKCRIGDTAVALNQKADARYSSFLWPCALVVSKYLVSRFTALHSLRVLELGAGTGLPSLLLAKSGIAERVLATDHQAVLDLDAAVCANSVQQACIAEKLEYGDLHTLDLLLEKHFPPRKDTCKYSVDIVVASDLFYDNHLDWPDILATIKFVLDYSHSSICILAYEERSSKRSIKPFLDELGLVAQQLPVDLGEDVKAVWTDSDEDSENERPIILEGTESVFLFELSNE